MSNHKKLTVGSLFAGIGGLELGLEMTGGFEAVWQVENNEFAIRVLEKHWPDVRRWGDVRSFPPCFCTECRKHWAVDLIAGGDPCQENSNARKATGGLSQPSLGGEFIRVVATIRPRLVLRENPAAVAVDAPWPWQRFRDELERLDYAVLPFRLRACCFGFDHRRDRLFLLAEMADTLSTRPQRPEFEELAGTFRQRCEEVSREAICDPARRNRRLPAPRVCRGADGVPHRVDRLRCLGNAVVPQVAQWIGERILAAEWEAASERTQTETETDQ